MKQQMGTSWSKQTWQCHPHNSGYGPRYPSIAKNPNPEKGRTKIISLDWEGQVLLVQSWICTLSGMSTVFIYTAVLCSQTTERLADLLGYAAFIAKCSQKFKWPSWVVLAAEENLTTWARPDPEVYAQSFTNYALSAEGWCKYCHSVGHILDTCPTCPKSVYPRKRATSATYSAANGPSHHQPMTIPSAGITTGTRGTVTLARTAYSAMFAVTVRKTTLFSSIKNHCRRTSIYKCLMQISHLHGYKHS